MRTLSKELNASRNSSNCASVSLSMTEPVGLPVAPISFATFDTFDPLAPMLRPPAKPASSSTRLRWRK
jgi:hypothetical protein